MSDETPDDTIRDAVVTDTTGFDLTVKDVEELLVAAGIPRSLKTIQRWCTKGYLDHVSYETDNGEIFKIRQSSLKHRIKEIHQALAVSGGGDKSRQPEPSEKDDAATTQAKITDQVSRHAPASSDTENGRDMSPEQQQREIDDDKQRQAETSEKRRDMSQAENQLIALLGKQLEVKDGIIADLEKSRDHEVKHYDRVRLFLGELTEDMQDVFEERNQLRDQVTKLLALGAGTPAPDTESEKEDEQSALPEAKPALKVDQPHSSNQTSSWNRSPNADEKTL